MKTLRKIPPVQLTLMTLLIVAMGLVMTWKHVARAQDIGTNLSPVIGNGDGLLGTYYPNPSLYGTPMMSRVDADVDFDFWQLTHPNGTLDTNVCLQLVGQPGCEYFGVRWVGEVEAQYTGPYTFYTRNDDGARVWLNEQLILDDWHSHIAEDVTSTTVNLVAGQRYLLVVEYFQTHGVGAVMNLSWSGPNTLKETVPQSQLYSEPQMDTNGLPVLWEEHYFGQTGVDPNADPDGDGVSNLQEWKQHTDPTNPQTRGVPDTWGHADVQPTSVPPGNAGYSNGVFTVSSPGADIWRTADEFHYVFQSLGTNGELTARVIGMQGTNDLAKAGLMVRETMDVGSRNAMVLLAHNRGTLFQWREQSQGECQQELCSTNRQTPTWLRIVRSGDWIGGYSSVDGTNWTLANWTTLKGLAPQVYIGMAVSSHDPDRVPASAEFDQVSMGPADSNQVMNVFEGNGDGLLASYRDDSLLYLPGLINQVEPEVTLSWDHEPEIAGLNPDSYGTCWSGEIQPQFTGPYKFRVGCRQEDWVRVWINEQLVIDGWRKWHASGALSGTPINLVAGQHYLIRVEMFNNLGHGRAILTWINPNMRERTVPQSQLYSQPQMDTNGLPVLWEQIYFGHTGVDPNADPDNDGLSNLQEYKNHTNPLKADTDGDGIPDAWEIAHGLDPQYAGDANLDYNNSGLSNLQDYQSGLDPFNLDSNGDGLPDWFEEQYLGTGTSFNCTNQITTVLKINGSQATNYLGNWQVDGNDIYCLDRRGGVDFNLPVSSADKYILNIIGTQNLPNPYETRFKLLLGIDGQTLGHYVLNAGNGTNGTVELILPYLNAGSHTLHIFWDGVASFSSLRIKQVKLLSVSDSDNDQNGIKDWADKMIADQSGLDDTNALIGSYTSPICLEGRDPYPTIMSITNGQTNNLSLQATTDGRWFANVPLNRTNQTAIQVSYQNGALVQTQSVQWLVVNLLTATNNLTIRRGDSLLFNAIPTNGVNGNLQIVIGTNTYSGRTTRPASYRFTAPGTYTVAGTYTPQSGSPQSGSVTVNVVGQNLPNVQPCAWAGMERALNLTNLDANAVLEADSRLTCFIAATNATGGVQLALGADANEPRSILARLGANGPILDSTQVQGFDAWSGINTHQVQVYPDGSQLVEMLVISSPVETNVTFVLRTIVSGVMFDDGTTTKILTATNFDALGQCPVRFIRPASSGTSNCHRISAYQGAYRLNN